MEWKDEAQGDREEDTSAIASADAIDARRVLYVMRIVTKIIKYTSDALQETNLEILTKIALSSGIQCRAGLEQTNKLVVH